MKIDDLRQIDEIEAKFLLYIEISKRTTLEFHKVRGVLSLSLQDIIDIIKDLWDKDIIDLNIDGKDIVLEFNSKLITLYIDEFNTTELLQFNKTLFFNNPSTFAYLIENCYIPKSLYDGSYMKVQDDKIVIDNKTVPKDKYDATNIRRRAESIVDSFYYEMHKKCGFKPSRKGRAIDTAAAVELVQSNPEITLEEYREAIDWFINDKFWSTVITSVYLLNKHFAKYLVKHPRESEENGINIF